MNYSMKIDKYTIMGMDCADCALHVENEVKKLPGVTDVSVNAVTGIMKISHPPKSLKKSQIIEAVRSAGYTISDPKSIITVIHLPDRDSVDKILSFLESIPEVLNQKFIKTQSIIEIRHTHPVSGLLSMLEESGFDVSLEKSKPDTEENSGIEKLKIALCSIFVFFGFALWNLTDFQVTAIIMLLAGIISGGYSIAKKGLKELLSIQPGMNLLMSIAVIGAMILGEWTEAGMVVFLFALAQYLEVRSMERARKSIGSLMEDRPVTARIKVDNNISIIPVEEVKSGQIIAVKPGERIPVDGKVIVGESYVNQSMITGESMPVGVRVDSVVFAGTLNKNGYLEIEAQGEYSDSTFSKIAELVEKAQSQKAPKQSFIEKFARYYTPAVMATALLVAIIPPILFSLSWSEWTYRALVLLVIACPCAFVISTPVTIISGLTNAIRKGIIIKGGRYLENFSTIKAIAFDKTGTLTRGVPSVQSINTYNGADEIDILTSAASLEVKSDHPLADAIVDHAQKLNLTLHDVKNIRIFEGKGITGELNGKKIMVGSHRLFEENGWCDTKFHNDLRQIEDENHTAVLIGEEDKTLGIIAIADMLREEAVEVITDLRQAGTKKIFMLTGDNKHTAESIGQVLKLDDIFADLLPHDKLDTIHKLKEQYGPVAMIGDGINDAPALAAAEIGIAMGAGGSDTALETADVALMDDDLRKIPFLKRLSNVTLRIIQENIFIALLLKFSFLIMAIPGYATLWMAVFADMGASLIVIFNGLRVLRLK